MKADPREGSQIRAGRAGRRRRARQNREKIWSQLPLRSRKLFADGEVTPGEAADLLRLVANTAQADVARLEERLEKLEVALAKMARGKGRSSPGRWGCYHPHPPQTRTCGFPASGSSRERFAPDGAFVGDLFDHPSDDAGRDLLVEEDGRPQSIWLSVVGSWTGSWGPESPRLFQANGSLLMAPPFPPSGPGEPGSPLSQVI